MSHTSGPAAGPRLARHLLGVLLAVTAAALAGCSTAPVHPALQSSELAELLPVRRFVANRDFSGGYRISPDGQRLLWQTVVGTELGMAVGDAAAPLAGAAAPVTIPTGPLPRTSSVGTSYTWLGDSRHVVFIKDGRGDENTQIHMFDVQDPQRRVRTLTPWSGARSLWVAAGAPRSSRFFFQSNRRDGVSFDLYEADAASGEVREVARNEHRVQRWLIDRDGTLAGWERLAGGSPGDDRVLEVLDADTGSAREVLRFSAFDTYWVQRVDRRAGVLVAGSNVGRDKIAQVERDLDSGRERVLASHEQVDIEGAFFMPEALRPYATLAHPAYPESRFLDAALHAEVEAALRRGETRPLLAIKPSSISRDGQRLVLRRVYATGEEEVLFDRKEGALRVLRPLDDDVRHLVPVEPVAFHATDGRALHGYLLRPKGAPGPVPLVVRVHGGPWTRDRWEGGEFNSQQMLANRGYAVLAVNYRGSSGYGKEFMHAGARQLARATQDDIAQAVRWAVGEGIADASKVAVTGVSFGGFSVLMQLIRHPEMYACGIDIVGVANWPRAIANKPPYWRDWMHHYERFYGSVDRPADREALYQDSPIAHIDKIRAPLLVIHGARDVRVAKQDSDDVVAALRALGRPVDYLVFDDEGHSIVKWRNRLTMSRRIEDFLASCLGGRSAGLDLYQWVP
ncbi:prolyl oligopeptidase family serine peptidase [Aquabacterium sp. A7-Y]|uniref:alpha/beta hydrolase family protein n=1 Tax=Aquabacterium sp. A7-Y TaxID=1349605 RepID=UPI00223E4C7B|nr:prolyl oligopeptidase family serine peptidase [Aquabacterium sp. A7-Y]MCW7540196.1 prolyl oligopeptidase family serine peptidase [Aquabacterium sp. A7-Y]